MQQYDVIIIGGGPAGLACAHELSRSDLRVLLLEKNADFGEKLCAGGITLKDVELMDFPPEVLEHKISRAALHSRKRTASTEAPYDFLFTVDRKELGRWQRNLLEGTDIEVRTECKAVEIEDGTVTLKNGEKLGFRYLVGADGYGSLVRRHLGLKTKKRLIGYQYNLPVPEVIPKIEIFLDARRFHVWYAWIFPHRNKLAVGCCFDGRKVDHIKVKNRFMEWLKDRNIDTGNAVLQAHPIACDYQGHQFGNIFLAGEAAGMPSWLTGEGIYQSLAAGIDIARLILDPEYNPILLKQALKYNRMLEKIMKIFILAGPLRGPFQEILVMLVRNRWIQHRINAKFS